MSITYDIVKYAHGKVVKLTHVYIVSNRSTFDIVVSLYAQRNSKDGTSWT